LVAREGVQRILCYGHGILIIAVRLEDKRVPVLHQNIAGLASVDFGIVPDEDGFANECRTKLIESPKETIDAPDQLLIRAQAQIDSAQRPAQPATGAEADRLLTECYPR
jgi:hypothetical protein